MPRRSCTAVCHCRSVSRSPASVGSTRSHRYDSFSCSARSRATSASACAPMLDCIEGLTV